MASKTWKNAAATMSEEPVATTCAAVSGEVFAPSAKSAIMGPRKTSIRTPHAPMYAMVMPRPTRARATAMSGRPAPMLRPTMLVTAMPKPTAGMNERCM